MIDSTKLRFDRDAWGRLILTPGDGQSHVGVEPVRCFPLSDPQKSIALLDSEGHELLTLADLDSLNPAAREILESELAARDFVPVIQRVVSHQQSQPAMSLVCRNRSRRNLLPAGKRRRCAKAGAAPCHDR